MPVAPIRYQVALLDPHSHELHLTIEIPRLPARDTLDLVFPAWAPGSYLVRDFSRHVYDLEIVDGEGALPHERLDKQRWRVHLRGRPITVRYRVFAFEISVRTSFFDTSRAFGNGTSLFFLVDGEAARPCTLDIQPPEGWHISIALPAVRGKPRTFLARDYDELVDSPFEVGTHERLDFTVGKTRFDVAFFGKSNIDKARMLADLQSIARTAGAMFGGFPFERYLFIIHALSTRGGGLEHACACTLDIAGFSFDDEKGYQDFAELAAHELFHAWNVKRIRDRVLGPFDYTRENYTRLLWFHEGFTEHMQNLVLLRAGLLSAERYLKDLSEDWTRYLARPGRNVTPLSELSYETWIKQYKPADNHMNRMVSYYDKGRWAGLVLDIVLRKATLGRRGLPDLFRRLWDRYAKAGRPIDVAIIRAEAEALAGRSLADYFRRYVDGTSELPVPSMLRVVGVDVHAAAPAEWERNDAVKSARLRAWCGLTFAGNGGGDGATVKNVVPDSPAWRAGLTYGDEIIAIDDVRVNGSTVSKRIADASPGQTITMHVFRKERLHVFPVRLARNPERRWSFTLAAETTTQAKSLRRGWLGIKGS
jgi:predicted metalloprotease with PDZ domain